MQGIETKNRISEHGRRLQLLQCGPYVAGFGQKFQNKACIAYSCS